MLKPSINEVLDKIDNRYYLVGTVAKRAREIIDGAEVYVSSKNRDNNKPVTIATQEVADEKITYRLLLFRNMLFYYNFFFSIYFFLS